MKKVLFLPASDFVEKFVEAPVPASQVIPNWYKNVAPIKESQVKYTSEGQVGLNLKACMPFIDALTAGYIQKTWTDIFIEKTKEGIQYNYPIGPDIMRTRNSVSVSINPSYYPIEFVWQSVWRTKLPAGYSLLITHPLNRVDLPFTTLTGFIDSDVFFHTSVGNIPFFIHSDFEGTIPAGTPMFQMIPIKRDMWESKNELFDEVASEKRNRQMRQHIWGAYKKMFRQKKTYR